MDSVGMDTQYDTPLFHPMLVVVETLGCEEIRGLKAPYLNQVSDFRHYQKYKDMQRQSFYEAWNSTLTTHNPEATETLFLMTAAVISCQKFITETVANDWSINLQEFPGPMYVRIVPPGHNFTQLLYL